MYKITLINMPFANLSLPSIALTQLKSIVEDTFPDRVRVRILYFNQEYAHFVGPDLYRAMTNSMEANNSGLGDWFFRQIAFPQEDDNTQPYFQRYFPHMDEQRQAMKGTLLAKRAGLQRFLGRQISRHKLAEENLVGMTSMFAQNVSSFAMARALKDANPNVVTVLGGANCEYPMGKELAEHVEPVDFVFSGPALISFPELVRCQLDGEPEKCHGIRGVFSKQNLGAEHLSGHGAMGEELPIEVPVALDYESFLEDLKRNFRDGSVEPSLTFETSRGCWWGQRSHCTFCGLNGGTMMYRSMPSEMAYGFISDLLKRYADRCPRFESVDNIMPREYLKELFPRLEPPPGVSFFYEVKADLKDHEMEILANAGVSEIQPGIESLATSTLKLMGKGTTSFQNLAFLKNCDRYGIHPAWNLLIGFPGESEEVYEKYLQDLPLLVHLQPPAGAFPVRFDRYSPYYVRAAEYGLDLEPYEFYGFIYPFGEDSVANMAYYFEDKNYDSDYLVQMVSWKSRLTEAVEEWGRRRSARDGKPRAELNLRERGGTSIVYDSREGEPVERELDAVDLAVLEAVDLKGLRVRDVARRAELAEETVAASVERLRGWRLLFEEGDRFMSCALQGSGDAARLEAQGAMAAAVNNANPGASANV